jgi:hypothetical protein
MGREDPAKPDRPQEGGTALKIVQTISSRHELWHRRARRHGIHPDIAGRIFFVGGFMRRLSEAVDSVHPFYLFRGFMSLFRPDLVLWVNHEVHPAESVVLREGDV